jgi:hypothetical protein
MDFSFIWQNLVWWVLGSLAVGALAKFKAPEWRAKWLTPILFAVGTFVLCFLTYTCVRVLNSIKPKPVIDENTVEPVVRAWMDDWGYGVQRLDAPAAYFAYMVTLPSGQVVSVSRDKNRAKHLTIGTIIRLTPDYQKRFNALSPSERTLALREILIETTRSKIEEGIDPAKPEISLAKRIPITENLTEFEFISSLSDVNMEDLAVEQMISTDIHR